MFGKSVRTGSSFYRKYRIIKELGRSSNGVVYKAWHKRLRKFVVIKIVRDNSAAKNKVHRNEFEALRNIKCLYIPQVLDFHKDKNSSFTVIEYIEGESFDKLLKIGYRFTEKQIIKWYHQLASALEAIHKNDIYHRDIKPANIILRLEDDICLIDFDSAYVSGNITGMISRSMGYASPEQYEYFKLCKSAFPDSTKPHTDHNETALLLNDCITEPVSVINTIKCKPAYEINWKLSDIYSLGATIYHLLTGNRPPVKPADIKKITNLQGYSKELLTIIEKSMKTNPLERYTSAEELKKYLL